MCRRMMCHGRENQLSPEKGFGKLKKTGIREKGIREGKFRDSGPNLHILFCSVVPRFVRIANYFAQKQSV